MTSLENWLRLASLLDDDPELAPRVERAMTGPADATATPDASDAPWAALLDGLDDAGALAFLEPTDTGIELAEVLAALPRVIALDLDVDPIGDIDGDLQDAVAAADALLEPGGFRLIYLNEGDESVPLVVVPTASVADITALAAQLGHEARPFVDSR